MYMAKKIKRELLESRRKGWDNLQVGLFLKSDGLITNNLRLSNKVLGERMFEIEKGGGGQDKAINQYILSTSMFCSIIKHCGMSVQGQSHQKIFNYNGGRIELFSSLNEMLGFYRILLDHWCKTSTLTHGVKIREGICITSISIT